jgi:predicted RNase H-like HicB family nuclease
VLDKPINVIDSQRLVAEREKFHAAIDTLDSALVRLEQLWLSHVEIYAESRRSNEKHCRLLFRTIINQSSPI